MTPAQLRRRVAYWMKQLPELGLAHYEFEMEIEKSLDVEDGDLVLANITVSDDYDVFTIRFVERLLDNDLEKIDRTIIHELLHVPVHQLLIVTQLVEDHLPVAAGEIWGKQLMHETESLVERLARTIYALHGG